MRNLSVLYILVALSIVGSTVAHEPGHKCIHDQILDTQHKLGIEEAIVHQEFSSPLVEVPRSLEKRSLEELQQVTGPRHDPLRVYVATTSLDNDPYTCYSRGQVVTVSSGGSTSSYTCTQDDVLTAEKRSYLVNTLLTNSVEWLEAALSVVRETNGRTAPNIQSCTSTPLNVPVPQFIRDGVDGDFVIFVTARPIMGGSTLAFASSCASNQLGRPIAGHANFNASNLVNNPNDLPRKAGLSVHEISHALGFSSSRWNSDLFLRYTTPNSNGGWNYVRLSSDEVVTEVTRSGYSFGRIITPSVLQAIRSHFRCDSLPGADLEDWGGSGTAGSHWEKRLFMNEYMTGTESNFPVRSAITLSLFQDTGWYQVDFRAAERFFWGKDMGCEFYNGDCGQWTKLGGTMIGLCDKANDPSVSCNFDRTAYGTCNIADVVPNIPDHFQHYGGPSTGGQSPIADYCGFVAQNGAATFCNTGGNSAQLTDILDFGGFTANGESFTLSSRCFDSTLNRADAPFEVESFSDITPPAPRAARCYNTTCAGPSDLRVMVDYVWYRCQSKGVKIKPFGYGGELECADPAAMCFGAPDESASWPLIESVSPKSGKPSTRITITGANFVPGREYEVEMEVLCTNVVVTSPTTIEATIPSAKHFVSLADLAIFQTRKTIVVRDWMKRTDYREKAFTIQVEFDGQYISNLFAWMGQNPWWALLLWTLFLLPFCCCAFCAYKLIKSRKKKPKPGAYHQGTTMDQYYQDDYEVEDYYDTSAPARPPPVAAPHAQAPTSAPAHTAVEMPPAMPLHQGGRFDEIHANQFEDDTPPPGGPSGPYEDSTDDWEKA